MAEKKDGFPHMNEKTTQGQRKKENGKYIKVEKLNKLEIDLERASF